MGPAPAPPEVRTDEAPAAEPVPPEPSATDTAVAVPPVTVPYVGDGPPTYDAEPTALPPPTRRTWTTWSPTPSSTARGTAAPSCAPSPSAGTPRATAGSPGATAC
ncbi:hypothetical protein [Streptomyces citrinus]|uniref:hypothetical protein n=1 Tax=Streptomyces citrinus TaxID=3118173 RepID=UPI003CC601D5